jgi:hypothetical protein
MTVSDGSTPDADSAWILGPPGVLGDQLAVKS